MARGNTNKANSSNGSHLGFEATRWATAGDKAKGDLSIFGQESDPSKWRLAKMKFSS